MPIAEDVVRRFCPVFVFHPDERFFPCSIDYLLRGGKLYVGETILENPTQQTLLENFHRNNYVAINASQHHGELAHAPLYYAIQEGDGFVQINYIPLYAFQGGQTCWVAGAGGWACLKFKGFDCIINSYGQHQGDLERVAVKLIPEGGSYRIAEVLFEAHGNAIIYPKDEVAYEGDHSIVHVALNGHSSHNVKMQGYHTVDDDAIFVQFDSFMGDGTKWKPYESGTLTQIGLDAPHGNPINDQLWAKFEGNLGEPQNNSLTSGTNLNGSNLNWCQWTLVKAIDWVALTFRPGTIGDVAHGEGPAGPGRRDWISPPLDQNPNLISPVFASSDIRVGTSDVQWLSASLQGQSQDSAIRFWNKNGHLAADVVVSADDHSFQLFSQRDFVDCKPDTVTWCVADINGDGLDEVLQMIGYTKLGINLFASTGTPTLSRVWSSQNMGEGTGAAAWLVTNLQGQQRQEIVQLWSKQGTLAAIVYATDGSKGVKVAFETLSLGEKSEAMMFLVADLQGEGRSEIVQLRNDNDTLEVILYASDGGAGIRESWKQTFPYDHPGALWWLVGDVNGDGREEIVQCWQSGTQLGMTLWGRDGQAGISQLFKSYDMGEGYPAIYWSIGDFNNDGKAEVAQLWDNNGSVATILYGAVSGNQMQTLSRTGNTHLSSDTLVWLDGRYTRSGIMEVGQVINGRNSNAGLNVYGNPINLIDG